MSGFYYDFTAARTTEPHFESLVAQLRTLDATAGITEHTIGMQTYKLKKNSDWTPAHITAAQTVLNTAPEMSPQRAAQSSIDQWPMDLKAAFILVMEQMNVLRGTHGLPAFTVQQFVDAIKAKAATL